MIKSLSIGAFAVASLALAACSHNADSSKVDTASGQVASAGSAPAANSPAMLRGTVVSASATDIVLQTDTSTDTVKIAAPFHVYSRAASSLADVKQSSFIGVTTVKQPDGTEQATEIHVFPEELRGLGEGSRMMTPDTTGNANRMTNGNVAASRMTNGSATPSPSASRMSNGNVSSTTGSTMVVQYAGGSQNVSVPANTPVTSFKIADKPLTAGDKAALLVTKAADGSWTSSKGIVTGK
jgi:hypothetical protein